MKGLPMTQAVRWTSADLELFPDDGKRYEVIDGELYVAKAPHAYHQATCIRIGGTLDFWDQRTGLGRTFAAPGVIFSPENEVISDIAWIRRDRLAAALDSAGHFRAAPDLVIEVLSPGIENEKRDREAKLKLYSLRGVLEYWIVDWRLRLVEVYRRSDLALALVGTVRETDTLTSPILPGFALPLGVLFADVPVEP
jgi:Uma2 family endonuclease